MLWSRTTHRTALRRRLAPWPETAVASTPTSSVSVTWRRSLCVSASCCHWSRSASSATRCPRSSCGPRGTSLRPPSASSFWPWYVWAGLMLFCLCLLCARVPYPEETQQIGGLHSGLHNTGNFAEMANCETTRSFQTCCRFLAPWGWLVLLKATACQVLCFCTENQQDIRTQISFPPTERTLWRSVVIHADVCFCGAQKGQQEPAKTGLVLSCDTETKKGTNFSEMKKCWPDIRCLCQGTNDVHWLAQHMGNSSQHKNVSNAWSLTKISTCVFHRWITPTWCRGFFSRAWSTSRDSWTGGHSTKSTTPRVSFAKSPCFLRSLQHWWPRKCTNTPNTWFLTWLKVSERHLLLAVISSAGAWFRQVELFLQSLALFSLMEIQKFCCLHLSSFTPLKWDQCTWVVLAFPFCPIWLVLPFGDFGSFQPWDSKPWGSSDTETRGNHLHCPTGPWNSNCSLLSGL